MKIYALIFGALLLSACKPPENPESTGAAATAENQAATQPQVPAAGAAAPSMLPAGLQLTFPHKIRSTGQEQVDGKVIHRAVIEFMDVDVAEVDSALELSLAGKGYRRYKTLSRGAEIVGDYARPERRVTVTVSPADGRLALSEGAKGTIYMVWND
ncbi:MULTISPECIES: hypothetical protein [unclassified Pseudoxanthomonas]|nr:MULTISPECIES: hypothetical protein [unclassified Pseudoxanthomonas]MBB3275584.1 hypothetical protein [Pseudoxanthomonas sp. OG2]MBV7473330.1 hypothetical protein [Pseudoxanthomonas sp. PXM05]